MNGKQSPFSHRTYGAVTRDTFTVVNDPFIAVNWRGTCDRKLSRDQFTIGNVHGYVKKKKKTAHDI